MKFLQPSWAITGPNLINKFKRKFTQPFMFKAFWLAGKFKKGRLKSWPVTNRLNAPKLRHTVAIFQSVYGELHLN